MDKVVFPSLKILAWESYQFEDQIYLFKNDDRFFVSELATDTLWLTAEISIETVFKLLTDTLPLLQVYLDETNKFYFSDSISDTAEFTLVDYPKVRPGFLPSGNFTHGKELLTSFLMAQLYEELRSPRALAEAVTQSFIDNLEIASLQRVQKEIQKSRIKNLPDKNGISDLLDRRVTELSENVHKKIEQIAG